MNAVRKCEMELYPQKSSTELIKGFNVCMEYYVLKSESKLKQDNSINLKTNLINWSCSQLLICSCSLIIVFSKNSLKFMIWNVNKLYQ